MPESFISYRRDDNRGTTGRLADKLVQQFGAEQVFRDLDASKPAPISNAQSWMRYERRV